MATQSGLIRSFYGWLVRRERALREVDDTPRINLLPARYPTTMPEVCKVAEAAEAVLCGTEHHAKAQYWVAIFDSIRRDGWCGEVRAEDRMRERIRQELAEALRGRDLAV